MCFRDRYAFVIPNGDQLKIITYYKTRDMRTETMASFKY
jgi:hypothetical protein